MDPALIFLFILLFSLSAFFSGSEIALMALPDHKIQALIKEKRKGSRSLKIIKEHNDRLLTTILIGNNLVNILAASLATKISLDIASNIQMEQAVAIAISTGIVTFLTLFFGEIAPKTYATIHADVISLRIAWFYRILMTIFYPITAVLAGTTRVLFSQNKLPKITEEEIETFIDMGKELGTLEEEEYERIKNVLEFDDTVAEEVMTPRVKIEALRGDMTVDEAIDEMLKGTHTRMPMYKERIDSISCIISTRDLLRLVSQWKNKEILSNVCSGNVIRVAINQPIDAIFEIFQESHQHIAIVQDDHGGVAGLITMEDIVEEIFGEIQDETDKEIPETEEQSDGSFLVRPSFGFEDSLGLFGISMEELWLDTSMYEGETLSYFLTSKFEWFPKKWDSIEFEIHNIEEDELVGKICFEAIQVSNDKIERVKIFIN